MPTKGEAFAGLSVALTTPFRGGELDQKALAAQVDFQIQAGTHCLCPVGTTGESPTLSHDEHERIIADVVQLASGRIKVMPGTGSNSTREALRLTKWAAKAGADAALVVAPYYNKPTQEGLYQHFKVIARATQLPIVLYSIPGRCGVEIGIETVKRLATDCKNIIGIKEAGGSCDRVSQLRAALGQKFIILSGEETLTLAFLACGANGVISVASNVIPREVSQMVEAFLRGNSKRAQQIHEKFYPLFKDLFIETNPVPVKAALAMMKMIEEEYRLPLVPMNPKNWDVLRTTMKRCGVLD